MKIFPNDSNKKLVLPDSEALLLLLCPRLCCFFIGFRFLIYKAALTALAKDYITVGAAGRRRLQINV